MKCISLKIYLPELKFYWILRPAAEKIYTTEACQLLQDPVSSPTPILKLFVNGKQSIDN